MPRDNQLATYTTKISTNEVIEKDLNELVKTGLYGKTTSEAAERLISERIAQLRREGLLAKPE